MGRGARRPFPQAPPYQNSKWSEITPINRFSFGKGGKRGVNFAADDVPDNWNFNGSNPCLHHGGNYNQNQNYGPFYINYNRSSNANDNIGCRILAEP